MDNHESGDDYIRRAASFIRNHERSLAESGIVRRRKNTNVSTFSVLNPLGWVGLADTNARAPTVLSMDLHHLFYILIRMEALGLDVGSLDVRVDNPTRPMTYASFVDDKVETSSIASFRSSISAISKLSLGGAWWGKPEPASVDKDLKYLYSSFTKLPALSIHAPGPTLITELVDDPPDNNAVPVYVFRTVQSLECLDIDPHSILGWDRLAESLRSLTIKRSGIDDPTNIIVDAVIVDQARRNDEEARLVGRKYGSVRSFNESSVPETVQEEAEDDANASESAITPTTRKLSPLKWAFLKHLSLSDNALTSISPDLFTYLSSLTHLDLSSNLLVSVPSGLSSLYNLIYLNLSDNMIDSVLGIYTKLGQILSLNLSRNRLDSICGLERLLALERVDVRHNAIEESAEIGRLAILPNITEVWVEGNPFINREENYRIKCFELFFREGKTIVLDGSAPGFYERQFMSTSLSENNVRTSVTAYSPPVHASESAPVVAGPSSNGTIPRPASPITVSPNSPSPALSAIGAKQHRKKNKRIVLLDDGQNGHQRSGSQLSTVLSLNGKQPADTDADFDTASSHVDSHLHRNGEEQLKKPTRVAHKKKRSRHSSEFAPSSPSTGLLSATTVDDSASVVSSSSKRRNRVSASLQESTVAEESSAASQMKDADAFRARIEALRNEVGDSWLHVLTQSQISPEPSKR